jgi:hypothetical protein
MQHSVRQIGRDYQRISELRKDEVIFDADLFYWFAKYNPDKYGIIENGEDLLVSTWHSDSLINDFQKTLK